jgi:hypothetical protein
VRAKGDGHLYGDDGAINLEEDHKKLAVSSQQESVTRVWFRR